MSAWIDGNCCQGFNFSCFFSLSLSLIRPNLIALKFAEKLSEHCPHSLVFMIDNNLINPSKPGAQPFYKIYSLNNQSLIESKM